MVSQVRPLGVDALADVAWGTHLCLFYQTPGDLTEFLGLYFKTGLANNESCLWVTSGPSETQQAMATLNSIVTDPHISSGRMQILDASQLYSGLGQSQANNLLSSLIEKEQQSIKNGFDGLRFGIDVSKLKGNIWPQLSEHEAIIHDVVDQRRIIAACCYSVATCEIADIVDITNSHSLTMVKRAGKWTTVERSEEALREGEERFRDLVETTSDWIWEVDVNGIYTYASPKVKELLGYEPQEVVGKTPFDFMPLEEAERVSSEFKDVSRRGRPFSGLENHNLHKDGHEVILETSGVPVFNKWHELKGYRGIDRDITGRKRAENALKQSEEKYRLLIENANEAITIVCDGKVCFANRRTLEMSGYTAEDLISKPFVDFIHPQYVKEMSDLYERTIRNERYPTRHPTVCIDKSGNKMWIETSSALIDWDGRPATISFITDITERKKVEELLHNSNQKFKDLVNLLPEAIYEIGLDRKFTFANQRAFELTGYSQEDLDKGVDALQLFTPERRPDVEKDVFRVLAGEPGGPTEYNIIHKNGSVFPAMLQATPILDGDKVVGIRGIVRDITEQKKSEDALKKSEAEYRLLIENANEAIIVVCGDKFRFVNSKTSKVMGYSREELMSRPFTDFVHPDDVKELVELYQKSLMGEPGPNIYLYRNIDSGGNIRWMEGSAVLVSWGNEPAFLAFISEVTERKQAEDALRKSEAKYRLVVENAKESIVVICGDKLVYANPKAEEITGYSREELMSMPFLNIAHPDDREAALKEHLQDLQRPNEKHFNTPFTLRIVDKNGNDKWVEVNRVAITWENKPSVLHFIADITERKKAEDALRQSEAKLRAMFESAAEGITVTDMKGHILEMNEEVIRLNRCSKEKMVGRNGFELVSPEDLARCIQDIDATHREGHFATREYSILRGDGTEHPIEVNVSLIRDISGKPTGIICLSRDITQRKLMEEALRKSEEKYRLIIENANESIVVIRDGRFCFVSPKGREITGYSVEELISRQFIDLIPPEEREKATEIYQRTVGNEPFPNHYSTMFIDKFGNSKWVEVNAVSITWEGQPALLYFVNDVTERKKAEDEVRKSRTELRRLSAHLQTLMERERMHIAHEIHDELGQQLTALKMDLSWIGKSLPKDAQPLIEKIKAMSRNVDTTIDTVRKISTDLRPTILDDFGLLAAIESILGEFQRRTGVKCRVSPRSSDVDLGQGRNMALFRIVQEALTNVARHANAANVEVGLKKRDGYVLLHIKDDGRGAKEEEISSSRSIGIVGMRERARLCKGQMRIKGVEGKGTVVKVSIPLKEEKADVEDFSG